MPFEKTFPLSLASITGERQITQRLVEMGLTLGGAAANRGAGVQDIVGIRLGNNNESYPGVSR